MRVTTKPGVVMQIIAALALVFSLRTGKIIVDPLGSPLFDSSMEKVRSPVETTRIMRLTPTAFWGVGIISRDFRRLSSRGRPAAACKYASRGSGIGGGRP